MDLGIKAQAPSLYLRQLWKAAGELLVEQGDPLGQLPHCSTPPSAQACHLHSPSGLIWRTQPKTSFLQQICLRHWFPRNSIKVSTKPMHLRDGVLKERVLMKPAHACSGLRETRAGLRGSLSVQIMNWYWCSTRLSLIKKVNPEVTPSQQMQLRGP